MFLGVQPVDVAQEVRHDVDLAVEGVEAGDAVDVEEHPQHPERPRDLGGHLQDHLFLLHGGQVEVQEAELRQIVIWGQHRRLGLGGPVGEQLGEFLGGVLDQQSGVGQGLGGKRQLVNPPGTGF